MTLYVPERKVWTQQPQRVVAFNPQLTPDALWLGSQSQMDVVSGLMPTVVQNVTLNQPSDRGLGVFLNSTTVSTTRRLTLSANASAVSVGASDFTVFVLFQSLGNAGVITYRFPGIGRWNTAAQAGTNEWLLALDNTTAIPTFGIEVGNSYYKATATAQSITVGDWFTLVGVRNGTTVSIYCKKHATNSVVTGSTTNAGITTANTGKSVGTYLGEVKGADFLENMKVPIAGTFKRALDRSEITTLLENPWQIFAPRRQWFALGAASSSQSLTQSATFTDADTFYTPSVGRGAVTLSPSLYSDADAFYAASISQSAGTQSLAQSATFTDADAFYTPAVSVGAVTLSPALFTDADAFYAPSVTQASPQTLTQSAVFENGNIFFEHRFASGAVGRPKFIWAKAKAKIADVPFEGKAQIIKAAKKQAKIDAIYDPCVLEYNDIQIKPPIVSDDEQVKYHAELAYRRAYYAAIQQRIAEYEQDEEDTLLALML